jgi:predicted Zn-dependent peptidase
MKVIIRNNFVLRAAALLGIAAFNLGLVRAQTNPSAALPAGQSLKGVQLKGKVPVNGETLKINLPQLQETTLSNGLRVVVLENHKVPTFSMQLVVLSGGLNDPAEKRGLASFTAGLLREGTAKRSSREIAEQIESLGASLNANAGLSSFSSVINVSGLKSNFDQTLDIFADVVRNPQFSAEEVEKYKNRNLPQIQFVRSQSQVLAQEKFYQSIYGSHPAGLILPSPEVLRNITSADLAKFYSAYYRPNNSLLVITGDVNLKELLPKLQTAFGDWQKAEVPQLSIPPVSVPDKGHIFVIDRPGSVQTTFIIGNLSTERTDPDYFPLIVMNQIFGAAPSSRLFTNLREDKGLTYGAYSGLSTGKVTGAFAANSEVRTAVTGDAMREFMYEFKRIGEEKVSSGELENAKRAIVGSFALSLEQPANLQQYIVTQKIYNLPADYWKNYPQQIAAVSTEDIQRVALKYLNPSKLQIVAVGDAAVIRQMLEKYGAVEVTTQK